ncbi:MAG: hypothetical protein B7X57_01920 [Erythrobacter sp. 34-65-8]|nr:MAG: hypothetical protein B7X57_01920 [Erythrobacter sp. 34-65-8]
MQVLKTTALAKSAISIRCEEGGTLLEIESFPSNEKIVFTYSSIGRSGLMYREPKKIGGKFNLYSIETQKRAIKYGLIGMYYVALVIVIAFAFGWIVSQFLDLF